VGIANAAIGSAAVGGLLGFGCVHDGPLLELVIELELALLRAGAGARLRAGFTEFLALPLTFLLAFALTVAFTRFVAVAGLSAVALVTGAFAFTLLAALVAGFFGGECRGLRPGHHAGGRFGRIGNEAAPQFGLLPRRGLAAAGARFGIGA